MSDWFMAPLYGRFVLLAMVFSGFVVGVIVTRFAEHKGESK